jgi:hypothetical protein
LPGSTNASISRTPVTAHHRHPIASITPPAAGQRPSRANRRALDNAASASSAPARKRPLTIARTASSPPPAIALTYATAASSCSNTPATHGQVRRSRRPSQTSAAPSSAQVQAVQRAEKGDGHGERREAQRQRGERHGQRACVRRGATGTRNHAVQRRHRQCAVREHHVLAA